MDIKDKELFATLPTGKCYGTVFDFLLEFMDEESDLGFCIEYYRCPRIISWHQ